MLSRIRVRKKRRMASQFRDMLAWDEELLDLVDTYFSGNIYEPLLHGYCNLFLSFW